MLGDLTRLLNASGRRQHGQRRSAPESLCALLALVEAKTITGTAAKEVFEEMFETGKQPQAIVARARLEPISGDDEIGAIVRQGDRGQREGGRGLPGGKKEALKFLVGQVMRETRGRANPAHAHGDPCQRNWTVHDDVR